MVRIPITIKIPVSGADLAHAIAVKIPHRKQTKNKNRPIVGNEIRRAPATRFPVPYKPRYRREQATYSSASAPRVRYNVKTFHITLTWPSFKDFRGKLRALPKKFRLAAGIIALAIIAIIVCLQIFSGNAPTPESQASATSAGLPKLLKGTPSYNTVLPAGKTIEQLGGWTRISPPKASPVYTYVDKISKVKINVSEQPLPKTLRANTPAKIEQLAEGYNATDKFMASNNTKVYVASADAGEQSVILTKSGLLILIKSAAPLSNNQWAAYISSLK